jgi:hypothetical protein
MRILMGFSAKFITRSRRGESYQKSDREGETNGNGLNRCPNTDLPVSTGLFMDEPTLSFTPQDDENRLRCPLYREIHMWQKEEAYLVEENEPLTGA